MRGPEHVPDDSQTKARIRLFGGFEVTGPDGASIAISSRKSKALLAILALSPGFKASRDRLIALLWSDRGDKQARNSLRQALVALRREFGDDCHTILFTDGDQVGLRTDSVSVDAVEFERMAESGDLADAASLYRGRLLDTCISRSKTPAPRCAA